MAVLDHVGVDHLVSKISEKISNVEGLTNEAYDLAGEANSMATTANDKAEEALKKNNNIEIWYTTSDGLVLTQGDNDTYENGRGVLVVDPSATTLSAGILGFNNSSRLTSLVLPCNHFQSIGGLAAGAITGFTYFEVPDSVKTISNGAFSNSKFTEIKLGSGLKTIGNGAFSNSSALETIDIPDSITEINALTFVGCTSLKTVKLSSSLEVIYDGAFSGCTSLETIDIPDSVTEIGTTAFDACTSLKTIKIGSGVTLIKSRAFRLSSGVTKCEIHSITPPLISGSVFYADADFKFYVPIESVDAYKQDANWSTYADRIVGVIFEDENIVSGENIKTINGQSLLGSGNIETPQPVYPYYLPIALSDITTCLGNNSSGQIEYDYDTYYGEIMGAILGELPIRIENDEVEQGGYLEAVNVNVDDYAYITFVYGRYLYMLSFENGIILVDLYEIAQKSDLSKYLPLSGGTLNGNLVTKQINVEAGNWVVTNGTGLMMQRSDGPSYIWNKTTGHSISIGTKANGDTSELNASLNIKGSNIYPGTSNKFSLGTNDYKFKDIYADGIVKGGRFLSGTKTKAEIESDTNPGLSISTTIGKDSFTNNYGLSVSDNANGVLAFRSHNGSGADYISYLGFTQKGLYYRNSSATATADKWVKLNNPSILSISVPEIEYSNSPKILPEIINGNITNVFHDIPQTMILIERSQDGTTWTDTTETDYAKFKRAMSSGKNSIGVPCVASDSTKGQVGDRVRITVNGSKAYSRLSHLYVYFSTGGATVKLSVEYNTKDDQNTWITLIDKQSCAGWSGPNYYGLNGSLIGSPYAGNSYSYRITFEITAIDENYNSIGAIYNLWALSSTKPYSVTNNSSEMFYFDANRWKYVTNKSIEPVSDVTYALGSSNYRWSSIYAKDFYGILHTPNGTNNHFVKGDGTITTRVNITHDAASESPLNQALCINSTTSTDDITKMPGIGFHNPGKSYATLKYTGTFEFMNETLTGHKNVKAAKFITTGGVSSQFVKGDGSLDSTKYVTEEQLIEVEEVTAAALTDLAENKVDTSELSNYMPKTGGTFTDTVYGTTFNGTLVGAIYNATW